MRNAQRVPLACFHRKGVLDNTDYDPYNGHGLERQGQVWGYGAYAVKYVLHQPQGMQVLIQMMATRKRWAINNNWVCHQHQCEP